MIIENVVNSTDKLKTCYQMMKTCIKLFEFLDLFYDYISVKHVIKPARI